jgi:hypothetical protein
MELYLDFIKKELEKNDYWDWRYLVFTWNGYHFYRVGEGKKFWIEEYKNWVEYHYQAIDKIFNDAVLKVDHACCNIWRVLRLPWTKNYARQKKFWLEPVEVLLLEDTGKISKKIK